MGIFAFIDRLLCKLCFRACEECSKSLWYEP